MWRGEDTGYIKGTRMMWIEFRVHEAKKSDR